MWTKFLLIVLQLLATKASVNVRLEGGLIYKNEGSAQINQDYLQYKRFMDINALYSVRNKLSDTTHMYDTYCSYVANRHARSKHVSPVNYTDEGLYAKMKNLSVHYISTTLKYPLAEAQSVCARLNARPVEIRDVYTYNAAVSYANEKGIQQFLAGIIWSPKNSRFEFLTDHTSAKFDKLFPSISYGGSYTGANHQVNWEKDKYLLDDADKYPLIYKNPISSFTLRPADKYEKMYPDFVMCEKDLALLTKDNSEAKNMFMTITNHACLRDKQSLKTQTDY